MQKLKVDISWSGENYAATTNLNGVVIVTHKQLDHLKKDFEETLKFHINSSLEDGDDLPHGVAKGKYELDYQLQISAILKELDGLVTRAALAKATGMNQKQLGHYIQGKKTPRQETTKKIMNGIRKLGNDILAVV